MIVVIVLLGILAAGAGLLITRPIESYNDQARRQQLVDATEMALRKVATDVRRALPNSIRVDDSDLPNSWALEMVNTVDGARYRDEVGGPFTDPAQLLDFTGLDDQFNILGRFSNNPTGTLRVAIYNTNSVDVYTDGQAGGSFGVVSRPGVSITADDGGNADPNDDEQRVQLTATGPVGHRFAAQSPGQRLFVVDGPVSYICNAANGRLTRHDSYALRQDPDDTNTEADLNALAAQSGRVLSNVSRCVIDYDPGGPTRAALLTLDLTLTEANESVRLLHQLHVDNLP